MTFTNTMHYLESAHCDPLTIKDFERLKGSD